MCVFIVMTINSYPLTAYRLVPSPSNMGHPFMSIRPVSSRRLLAVKRHSPVNGKVYFAMKANSALGILALIGKLGGGMDIVSVGELARAIAAGIKPVMWCFLALKNQR